MSRLYDFPQETNCQRFLKSLAGSWTTESGNGSFPTMMPFRFGAELNVNKTPVKTKSTFYSTSLSSWPPGKKGEIGTHFENGFLRCVNTDELEYSITHSTGMTEVLKGKISESSPDNVYVATLESTHIGNSGDGVQKTKRILEVNQKLGLLSDTFFMATTEVPNLTEHLKVSYLKRHRT